LQNELCRRDIGISRDRCSRDPAWILRGSEHYEAGGVSSKEREEIIERLIDRLGSD
jgi:hypothetical protein